jgi:hypothetical protein
MRIYVASSWRNTLQPGVVVILRRCGHEVYDFRHPAPDDIGFAWTSVEPTIPPWSGKKLRAALEHPIARRGYGYDMAALKACEAVVLVLPCGRSAHWELGYAMGQGKPGYVVMLGPDEPELMYSEARILTSSEELFDAFEPPGGVRWEADRLEAPSENR